MIRGFISVSLFALYPILVLVNANIDEIIFADAFFPIFLSLFISIAAYFVLFKITQNQNKSALFIIISLFFFFYYGHIFHGYFSGKHLGELTIGRHRFFFPLWCFAYFVSCIVLIKTRKALDLFLKFLSYLFLILTISILIPVLNSLNPIGKGYIELNQKEDLENISVKENSYGMENKPDIYYIVLDGYASFETLMDFYQFDNSDFYESLNDRGFYIAEESVANHSYTYLSLSSTLNMMYMNWMAENNSERQIKIKEIGDTIADNKVAKLLKLNGYEYITFDSGYSTSSRSSISDQNVSCSSLSEFDRTLIKTTILDPFFLYGGVREMIMCQFESLKKNFSSNSKFVFTHIVAPHPPFVFNSIGGKVGMNSGLNPWADKNAYSEQLQFVNNKVIQIIDHIKAQNVNNDFIMIIQSDHGPASLGTEEMLNPSDDLIKERMRILNVYYVPEKIKKQLYKNISPVNTFRLILSEVIGIDLPLLPDQSFFTPIGQEKLIFENVTTIASYE